nr:MAG TPA_asm: hypothetical protein [Caudoviricetes sp.]DAP39951.1 MAG TPA: hypothetical protein [Caudoviricetes sp.]DAZ50988.1 MAG TPA: hypothetical protein [Caudoviricetes sp.]
MSRDFKKIFLHFSDFFLDNLQLANYNKSVDKTSIKGETKCQENL